VSRHEASRVPWYLRPFKERLARYDWDQTIQHISRDVHQILELLQKETATTNDDDKIFHTAPAWGKRINEKLNTLKARVETLIETVGREARADKRRDLKTMAAVDITLAKVTANNDLLKSLDLAVDVLNEEHATIAEKIADLKAQVEAGQPPDFTALDAAVDEQTAVISRVRAAVGANAE